MTSTSMFMESIQVQSATALTQRTEWQALQRHAAQPEQNHLRELFAADPASGERLHAEAAGLYLDYCMFRGGKINRMEDRSLLHVALRAPQSVRIDVDGNNIVPEVHAVLDRMATFSERVRSGTWTGQGGMQIRNVINIGIGGSGLRDTNTALSPIGSGA